MDPMSSGSHGLYHQNTTTESFIIDYGAHSNTQPEAGRLICNGREWQVVPKPPGEVIGELVLRPMIDAVVSVWNCLPSLPPLLPGAEAASAISQARSESRQLEKKREERKAQKEREAKAKKREEAKEKKKAEIAKKKREQRRSGEKRLKGGL